MRNNILLYFHFLPGNLSGAVVYSVICLSVFFDGHKKHGNLVNNAGLQEIIADSHFASLQ